MMSGNSVKKRGNFSGLRRTWPLWLLGLCAAVLSVAGGDASPALRYERANILHGEAWRLATGQLVHLGMSHLALNLAGLLLIGWLFAPVLRASQWLLLLAGSWLAICAGFLLLEPQLAWYVGLSGILHGLLLGAAVLDRGLESRVRILLIAGILAKLAWEQWAGALPFTAEAAGGPVVVDAHLYGGLGGLFAGIPLWLRDRRVPSV